VNMGAIATNTGAVGRPIAVQPVLRVLKFMRQDWSTRRERPWLALIAVPLAMNATGLLQLWWLWPILLVVAAVSAPSWWWVLSVQLAIVGTEWAYVGCVALAMWPSAPWQVGIMWGGVALALAVVGMMNRRYQNLPERGMRL
jgi:hypothetical protein